MFYFTFLFIPNYPIFFTALYYQIPVYILHVASK